MEKVLVIDEGIEFKLAAHCSLYTAL
jgi:hypothetical protein